MQLPTKDELADIPSDKAFALGYQLGALLIMLEEFEVVCWPMGSENLDRAIELANHVGRNVRVKWVRDQSEKWILVRAGDPPIEIDEPNHY